MATEGIYPQIVTGSLGSTQGLAERLRDIERELAGVKAVKTYIGQGSIQTGHIAVLSITAGLIQAGAINSGHIQTLSINAGHMQADSITVTNAALSNLVVTTAKIADLAVLSGKIGDLQVTTAKIGDLAVQTAKIDNLAVTTGKIANLAVQTAKIEDLAVTTAKIALLAVDSAQLKDASIITAKIGDAQITNAKVANLDGGKINVGTLNADRLIATSASADTLLARLIHAGSLIATTGLSAVSANMGTITAGTVTGATIQSAASGGRWVGNSAGLRGYALDGTTVTFAFDNSTGKIMTLAGLGGFNLVKNSSFEDPLNNLQGWGTYSGVSPANETAITGMAGAGIGDGPTHGSRICRILATTTLTAVSGIVLIDRAQVKPGEQYTLSVYAITDNPSGSNQMSGHVHWYDAAGSIIGGGFAFTFPTVTAGPWARKSITTPAAPAGAVTAAPYIWAGPGLTTGASVFLDAVQFEQGTVMTAYSPKADENLANSIGANELAPNSVSGNKAGVAESHIIPGTIIATDLFVSTLSAITANMGTLSAGRIEGGTIAGGVIDAGSLNSNKLSVGAWARSPVMNGGFEDLRDGDATMAAHWNRGTIYGGTTATSFVDAAAARSGSRGLKLVPGAGNAASASGDGIAVGPGEVWTMGFWARKTGTGTVTAYATLWYSNDPSGPVTTDGWWVLGNVDISTSWTYYSAQITIPAGYTWAFPLLLNFTPNTGAAFEIDEVSVRKTTIGTEILDGAITTLKLSANAIDGKTITGATIQTSVSNPRIKIQTSGAIATDSSGGETFSIDAASGAIRQGKRAYASNEILAGTGSGSGSTGTSVTIPVQADSLVKLYVEAEIKATGYPGYFRVAVVEATDFPGGLEVMEANNASYTYQRTAGGVDGTGRPISTQSKLAGEIVIRPSSEGIKTYTLYWSQEDSNFVGGGGIRNRRIHATTV